jgi:tRNA C32,U32 (ribose-2'-O)-methylase TrmJ
VLDRAQVHVIIPTTEHASLNLAQAVLIALYELHLVAGDATRRIPPPRKDAPPATTAQLEQYFADLQRSLASIEFFKTRQVEHIMRTVRSLTMRAAPDARELSLIRAMALEVLRYMERQQLEQRR